MRSSRCFWVVLLLAGAWGLAGCQKRLNDQREVTLEAGDIKTIEYDAPRSEQKLSLVVTPSGVAVDVYVVPQSEIAAVKKSLEENGKPARVLASKERINHEETLEATIPARTTFAIVLSGAGKSTRVKLQTTGR